MMLRTWSLGFGFFVVWDRVWRRAGRDSTLHRANCDRDTTPFSPFHTQRKFVFQWPKALKRQTSSTHHQRS